MGKHVSVTTLLKQASENGQDEIAGSFSGTCLTGDGKVMLCYDEPDNGGPTRLTASHEAASLRRSGQVCSRMGFRPGGNEVCLYKTPLGTLRMAVRTHAYRLQLSARGGAMETTYTVSIGGTDTMRNTLHIVWTVLD